MQAKYRLLCASFGGPRALVDVGHAQRALADGDVLGLEGESTKENDVEELKTRLRNDLDCTFTHITL